MRGPSVPISPSDMIAMFDILSLDTETRLYWFEVIRRVDQKYLELIREKQKQEHDHASRQKSTTRHRRS